MYLRFYCVSLMLIYCIV